MTSIKLNRIDKPRFRRSGGNAAKFERHGLGKYRLKVTPPRHFRKVTDLWGTETGVRLFTLT